jgi:hypothetical protein
MTEPQVTIRFDGNGCARQPGDILAGDFWVDGVEPSEVKTVEVSVLWYTEGKGSEDMAVHEFWRRPIDAAGSSDPNRGMQFRTCLPMSPLSYDGQIVKIRWCVRVRAFLSRGKEVAGQKVFRLGSVPAPAAAAAPPPAQAEGAHTSVRQPAATPAKAPATFGADS